MTESDLHTPEHLTWRMVSQRNMLIAATVIT